MLTLQWVVKVTVRGNVSGNPIFGGKCLRGSPFAGRNVVWHFPSCMELDAGLQNDVNSLGGGTKQRIAPAILSPDNLLSPSYAKKLWLSVLSALRTV